MRPPAQGRTGSVPRREGPVCALGLTPTPADRHPLPRVAPRRGSSDVPFPANDRDGDNYDQNYSGPGRNRETHRNDCLQFKPHVSKDTSVTFREARTTEKMLSEIPLMNQTPEGLSRPPPWGGPRDPRLLSGRVTRRACSGEGLSPGSARGTEHRGIEIVS